MMRFRELLCGKLQTSPDPISPYYIVLYPKECRLINRYVLQSVGQCTIPEP